MLLIGCGDLRENRRAPVVQCERAFGIALI
jgi:hypothetical protein